jgi:hypothetical protein
MRVNLKFTIGVTDDTCVENQNRLQLGPSQLDNKV